MTGVTDVLARTESRMAQWRDDALILHGVQLYVSFRHEVLVDAAWGEARPGVEVRTDTIFRQHCTAAPLTAFALAPLVGQREVGLDNRSAISSPSSRPTARTA